MAGRKSPLGAARRWCTDARLRWELAAFVSVAQGTCEGCEAVASFVHFELTSGIRAPTPRLPAEHAQPQGNDGRARRAGRSRHGSPLGAEDVAGSGQGG